VGEEDFFLIWMGGKWWNYNGVIFWVFSQLIRGNLENMESFLGGGLVLVVEIGARASIPYCESCEIGDLSAHGAHKSEEGQHGFTDLQR